MDPKVKAAVFIIESPDANDVLDGRSEGGALSAALDLADVKNHHYTVFNKATLAEAFERIAVQCLPTQVSLGGEELGRTIIAPHLHFSLHGDEGGIALTSGEELSWDDLRTLLLNFARRLNLFNKQFQCGHFPVTMSACRGINARKMFERGKPYPCIAVIGSPCDLDWSDALTAYIVFYHLVVFKDRSPQESVDVMNAAIGIPDAFQGASFLDYEPNTQP
jgi:hypothetical protein